MNKDYQTIRMQLWSDVYCNYTRASNSTNKEAGTLWADYALAEFDQRFKENVGTKATK